ncbi:STAS/SEC14 domain-containing protein [Hyphobacterium sp. HN65]|uniref:STAS/SEC14 domain-containing protein n=1 Tax=Hyphobacterium lacteum TaxID=3116575 RepID=A0ABU7LSX0_9PROT|nr:STAS/SEC14 domain-containing protein [Hyphobacterium sp. HN65]MEE2526965.1 STAS/SEC14 domain-containing protein [Hyphobacterium sp. HN65]
MTDVLHDPETGGSAELTRRDGGILQIRYAGSISLAFVEKTADRIITRIEDGARRILYLVEDSTPLFTPAELTDEVRRVGRAGNRQARFAYLAPEDMFTKHFMLIEAAAFNEGVTVKFFSDKAAARAWLTEDN